MKRLPVSCPSCGGDLAVRRLCCAKCQTEIEGLYPLPPLAGFSPDDQEFILEFIKASYKNRITRPAAEVAELSVRSNILSS